MIWEEMLATTENVFDLDNGYIVVGDPVQGNIWQTNVEAILCNKSHESRPAFLSSRCRAEDVSPKKIFHSSATHEFSVVSGYNMESVALRSGVSLSGSSYYKLRSYQALPFINKISCNNRPAHFLDFDEAYAYFCDGPASPSHHNKIYMRVRYKHRNEQYDLYAPCRYTNYHKLHDKEPYIQPISDM